MKKTCHSEYGTIESIFIKSISDAFISQANIDQQWQALNYLDAPDLIKGVEEYKYFEKLILTGHTTSHYLPASEAVGMDSIYCRDASIATDFGMILCNMGKQARKNEPQQEKNAFERLQIPILGEIIAPGTIEGGDVAWLDHQTLAVGHTYRTNPEGIRQLKALLEPKDITVVVAQLPHYKGPSDVFHLMSILSPVAHNLAVVYAPLMPIAFRELLLDKGYELIEVPDNEFESMGCNVLAIAPRKCVMVAGNPITRKKLESAGCEVLSYEGEEISVKGGGGPTCLTRPIWRRME